MKSKFPGFYTLSDKDKKELFKKATIIVDNTFLLDLFRLNEKSVRKIFSVLNDSHIKHRLWIPYDVAWIYHNSVNNEITYQIKNTETALKNIINCKEAVFGRKCFPYFNERIESDLKKLINDIEIESNDIIDKLKESLKWDYKKERINQLFSNIGEPYEKAEMNTIYKEAQERYEKDIPPGYLSEPHSNLRVMYNDMVIWKQILKYSEDKKKDVILVLGHRRDDWFYTINNIIAAPRHEIINEFANITKQRFHCVCSAEFVIECCELFHIIVDGKRELCDELNTISATSSSFNSNVSTNMTINSTY